ncbi:gluconate 2-dehydrogenase subunit 3 family protein [Paenibacillus sp. KQZ6P-2]|uniref:Gluconate 2-dehydrogenase subunit 3 family protein n=1 Tax=Paenibacillus mangrovi TaxID=2931978 RepID=A0A9X1WLN1_9BACL|nr:gluconate 2-dehydrogenase subunit 3 family protein [Paenibacillus mangrovi]MCJ8011587.1 gluconate 2-dehydrogenase subunit 3 family protein [Paenibacillus mangrovi]
MANETEEQDLKDDKEPDQSRRNFLKNTGYAVGGLIVGGVVGSLLRTPKKPTTNTGNTAVNKPPAAETVNFNQALMYFTQEQFLITEAATERLFPADDNGPGAKEIGVAYYIDHQLAGEWGTNGKEYMQGPFFKGETTQGYQGRLKRREIFDIGLQEMQNYSNKKFQKKFKDLTPEQQDTVLKAFETDEVKLTTISASGFFKTLFGSTLEGVYADPLYGGNGNMAGWKLKNFPGNQMSYTKIIEQDKFEKMPPVSLREHLPHG